jgi:hypothetical protein
MLEECRLRLVDNSVSVKAGRHSWPRRRRGGRATGSESISGADCARLSRRGASGRSAEMSRIVKLAGRIGSSSGRTPCPLQVVEAESLKRLQTKRKSKPIANCATSYLVMTSSMTAAHLPEIELETSVPSSPSSSYRAGGTNEPPVAVIPIGVTTETAGPSRHEHGPEAYHSKS